MAASGNHICFLFIVNISKGRSLERLINAALLLIISFFFFLKLTFLIACSLENSKNFFIQSLPLYASCLFSMLLNGDTIEIDKPDANMLA